MGERKIGRRACNGCKIRKVKCSEIPPCKSCVSARIECAFTERRGNRGPKALRPKTLISIAQTQRKGYPSVDDGSSFADESLQSRTDVPASPGPSVEPPISPEVPLKTRSSSLIVQLCVYRLRLYPIWPIVAVEEIMGSLQGDVQDMETYALANAIGAATIAQLKLDQTGLSTATGSSMAEECQRTKLMGKNGQSANLNILRIAFFLHIYYENQDQGGVKSLLFLREAITIAQIMGLHRLWGCTDYGAAQRVILSITSSVGATAPTTHSVVAVLILKPNLPFPAMDGDDETQILPAFQKLVDLFWTFDQSRAFEILEGSSADVFETGDMESARQNFLYALHKKLQEVSLDWDSSSEVQRADMCHAPMDACCSVESIK
ncbi:hypothetical protein VE02_04214 [Pseudogymnoascus sp. 03VT05]|nr:hypothetical protein VE02_04214 [Pseudogymnoascus sp. 03VT05]